MNTPRLGTVRGAVVAALCGLYAVLSFLGARAPQPNVFAACVAFVPLLALLAWVISQSAHRLALSLVSIAAAALLWDHRAALLRHYDWGYLAENAGTMALLSVMFAQSLRPKHVALVTQVARIAHGSISERVAAYTRGVTWAWALFFAAMAISSLMVFLALPLAKWAVFSDALTPLLVLAMFVIEYLVRRRALPPHERTGAIEAVRAYARYRTDPARGGRRAAARCLASPSDRLVKPSLE